jgi:hypothetical protein
MTQTWFRVNKCFVFGSGDLLGANGERQEVGQRVVF